MTIPSDNTVVIQITSTTIIMAKHYCISSLNNNKTNRKNKSQVIKYMGYIYTNEKKI